MTFGQRLYHFRKLSGLSQAALAEKAKVNRPTITLIENGTQQSVTIDIGQRLAKALGIKFMALVGEDVVTDAKE